MGIKVTEADRQFSLAVRAAAANQCEHCGVNGEDYKLECAHLHGRRNARLRWDMLNAASLCHNCHRDFTENPKDFSDWVEREWPGRWAILNERRQLRASESVPVKNTKATRAEVSAHYRAQLRALQEARRAGEDYEIVSWI